MKEDNKAYEKYLRGIALQAEGKTGTEIAELLGYKDAQAWYSSRTYFAGKRLAARAVPRTLNQPEPAAILEGVDCERSAPRPSPGSLPEPTKAENRAQRPVPQPRMKVRRVLAAEGDAARYRFEAGVVQINTSGQKRASLALYPDECRQMMRELAEFLEQIEEVQI